MPEYNVRCKATTYTGRKKILVGYEPSANQTYMFHNEYEHVWAEWIPTE